MALKLYLLYGMRLFLKECMNKPTSQKTRFQTRQKITQEDLIKTAKKRIHDHPGRYNEKIFGQFDSGGTGVLYLAGVSFDKLGFPALPEYSSARISEGIQHTIYHNMIAPVLIYFGIAFVAFRNIRAEKKAEKED